MMGGRMREMTDGISGVGTARNKGRKARYRWSYIVCIVGAVIGGWLVKIGEQPGQDAANIAGLSVMLASLLVGMALYHAAIDEHEKNVVLWTNSVALYVLIALMLASLMLRRLNNPIMLSMQTCLVSAAAVGLLVFVWRKYL